MAVVQPAGTELGELLRHWRRVRGKSQFELALDATTTPRYVSFVETGRAQPSRQMVVRLARALDVPLRERNGLLLAAGYAPLYTAGTLDGPELDCVRDAIRAMLAQHEPFPAVVMDRAWTVLQANGGCAATVRNAVRARSTTGPGERARAHDRARARPRRCRELE